MRHAAGVLHMIGSGEDITLLHPYVPDGAVMFEKHVELEKRRDDPALQAKLKEARRKHMEAKKNGA